jgi:uncharacterized protein
LAKPISLPDVNVLLALSDTGHVGHGPASRWFGQLRGSRFALCPITEAGFVRLSTNPHVGGREIGVAVSMLETIRALPNRVDLPMDKSWMTLAKPLLSRLHGYRQVTDALLLGLAIRHECVLVTLDQHVRALAGAEFRSSVLVLE